MNARGGGQKREKVLFLSTLTLKSLLETYVLSVNKGGKILENKLIMILFL